MTDLPAPMGKNEFQEQLRARLRSSISELMPDSMLQTLIQQAVKDELYRNVGNHLHPKQWITEEVNRHFGAKIKIAVDDAMQSRDAEVMAMIEQTVRDRLPEIIAMVIMSMLKGQASVIEMAIFNAFQQRGM